MFDKRSTTGGFQFTQRGFVPQTYGQPAGRASNQINQVDEIAISRWLAELPQDDDYYMRKYGIDKSTFAAYFRVGIYSHHVCSALEVAEDESPNYSPLFP